MFGISSDGRQGFGYGSKQNVVDDLLVLVSDRSDLFGDRENDMKIVRGEDFGHSLLDPLGTREGLALWAMAVPAAVIARPLVTTAVAAFEMPAESCGATHLDRSHDALLCRRERPIMLLTIGFAVAAEDVRHFELRATHRAQRLEVFRRFGLDLHRDRARQQIQRTRCRADFAGRYAKIFCCSGQAAMTEQQLNGTNVGALFQQMDGKSVPKRMRCDRFRDLANTVGLLTLLLNRKSCDVPAREVS